MAVGECGDRMNRIIIISHENQIKKLNKITITDSDMLIALKDNIKKKCLECFFNNVRIYDYWEVIKNYKSRDTCIKESEALFHYWDTLKINKASIFMEYLGYKNTSIFDLNSIRLLSGHTDVIVNLLQKLSVAEAIINELKPQEVVLLKPETDWETVIVSVCKKHNIHLAHETGMTDKIKNFIRQKFIEIQVRCASIKIPVYIPIMMLPVILVASSYLNQFNVKDTKNKVYEERKILIYIITKKYADVVIPVVEAIEKDSRFSTLVLVPSNFDGIDIFKENNIPYDFLNSYLTKTIEKNARTIYIDMIKKYLKVRSDTVFRKRMYTYDGINIENMISGEIDLCMNLSINNIRNMLLMERIVSVCHSGVLFTPHFSENIIKSLVAGCNNRGITSIGMIRGATEHSSELSTFNGNLILAQGVYSKRLFDKWESNKGKMTVTGTPMFDDLLRKIKHRSDYETHIRNKFQVKAGNPIVTYLTQSFSGRFNFHEREIEVSILYEIISRFDDIFFIIKIHPTEYDGREIHQQMAVRAGLKNYTIIKDEVPLDDLLLSSKVVITKNSSAGLNALVSGCTLIVLGLTDKAFTYNFFVESGVALTAAGQKELHDCIVTALANKREALVPEERINKFLEEQCYKLDGDSSRRIKQIICNIVQ